MKNKCNETSDSPKKLPFELIKLITNDFSEELGRGAFGQVFKGVLEDGEEVAVKMLHFMPNVNEQQFENEFEILRRLEHPNIVRLVAFCDEAQEVCVEYNGKLTVCQRIHRALCLEYMPNGSLGKLLSGENLGNNNWPIRYKIIKGICDGLEYLREGLEFPIFHLDLKPDNILLNQEMMPKISDFGLSRLIGEENSKKTLTPLGTIGYLPPEFINYQVISKEYDIYSLGVIITKTITGITGYSDVADMGAEEFVEHGPSIVPVPSQDLDSLLDEWGLSEVDESYVSYETPCGACMPVPEPSMPEKSLVEELSSHKDPPSDITHHAHPQHNQKPTTDAGAPFLCDGCKEPGYGPRYTYDCGRGQSLDLHTRCGSAEGPLFDLHTLVHPLFGYGKQFEFRFLQEAPSSPVQEEGRRVCDACGEATGGFVYHCSEQGLHLHPCCASLPDRIIQDRRAFDLHRRPTRPCALCPDNEGQRRWFWAYRCLEDDEAVELHVACLKEMARRSWEAYYRNQDDVGGGALNVDSMLENMFSSTFGDIAGTLASFITALVFGSLIVKM